MQAPGKQPGDPHLHRGSGCQIGASVPTIITHFFFLVVNVMQQGAGLAALLSSDELSIPVSLYFEHRHR